MKPSSPSLPRNPAAPAPRPGRRTSPSILAPFAFLLFSLLVVFLTIHTDRATRSFGACAVPPDTIQGISSPRFFLENDFYVWLSHARDLFERWHLSPLLCFSRLLFPLPKLRSSPFICHSLI